MIDSADDLEQWLDDHPQSMRIGNTIVLVFDDGYTGSELVWEIQSVLVQSTALEVEEPTQRGT